MANKIVFKHQQAGLESLSIAGNFTEWEIKPMILNEVDHQWEFEVNNTMLAPVSYTHLDVYKRQFLYHVLD